MGRGAGMAQKDVDAVENLPAVGIQAVEGARPGQVFQLPPVDGLGIQAPGEVEQVLERTVSPALGDHRFHGRFADVLDRGERIPDGPRAGAVALDRKHRAGRLDVGGQQRHAQVRQFVAEGAQLVGVVDVHGHRGGQEFDRIIGLHVGRLVGDHGIGGGVGLVEAVAGELGHLIEDVGGLGRGYPARLGAVDEGLALLGHLRFDLLAHGAAQKVGVAEGEPGQFLGDLHDLFLVDHDAEGFLEDAFQRRVQIVRFLLAALAFDVTGDVLHGPRAVERHHGDDVLEGVEPELAQHLAHAGAFQLEHAGGLAAAQHLEGEGVVQGQIREVDVDAPFADQLHGPGQHGQGLETEKIELHQPRQFHVFHAEAGHRHVRAWVAV